MTDLKDKCGECENYTPIKSIYRGKLTEYAQGTCSAKGKIVQRTDRKCKGNFKKRSDINEQINY